VVREAHAQWHEECGQVVWDEAETEILPTLEHAKERYAKRRRALCERGFIYSDMDLF